MGKKYEECFKTFMEVRNKLMESGEDFALARAFHKPIKWYGEHEKAEALAILRSETNEVKIIC